MRPSLMRERIAALYESAPIEAMTAGNAWYEAAREAARALAKRYDTTEAVAAGVIAALSPRVHWSVNLRLAEAVLSRSYERGAFKANLHKAMRIAYDGERPLDVLSGPKVRAFYRAIRGDQTAAVIDVWMLRAIRFTKTLKPAMYALVAQALAAVAKLFGTTVARMQAVVWTVIRGSAT